MANSKSKQEIAKSTQQTANSKQKIAKNKQQATNGKYPDHTEQAGHSKTMMFKKKQNGTFEKISGSHNFKKKHKYSNKSGHVKNLVVVGISGKKNGKTSKDLQYNIAENR